MADAIWYYAVEDEEKGPVTAAQLKALAGSGKLKSDDLVWREGLDDWKPAREISGLFTGTAAKTTTRPTEPAPPPAAEPAKPKRSAATPQPQPAEPQQEPEPVQQVSQAAPMMAPAPAATAPVAAARSRPLPLTGVAEPLRFGRFVGQPLLLIGLMLVLLAKGCDSVGNRYLEQINGKLVLEKNKFDASWEPRIAEVRDEIEKYRTDEDSSAELEVATEKLARLQEERAEELRELEQKKWPDLEVAARNADSENKVWRYYREIIFVGGTILLTLGLLAVGFTDEGAQKWICLIMLAIIVFSLFVHGSAWLGALTSSLN